MLLAVKSTGKQSWKDFWAVIKEFNRVAATSPFTYSGSNIRIGKLQSPEEAKRRVLITRVRKAALDLYADHDPNVCYDKGIVYFGNEEIASVVGGDLVWREEAYTRVVGAARNAKDFDDKLAENDRAFEASRV